jgi:type I restriction enzyme S subunit
MSWPTLPLDEIGTVARGRSRHRPRNAEHLYGGPFPFVQTGDVKKAPLYLNEYSQTYSEAGLAQSKMWPKGTLCITIAANIAETAILDIDACFPDSIIGFTVDPSKANTKFIKYQFDALLSGQMRTISQGAAQDNLSQAKLLSFEFSVPDLPTQERIAAILSAYDDLIENNRRRIALLEQAARLLYREWFVHFRFPGHETAKFVDGLPEGWERKELAEVADFHLGKMLDQRKNKGTSLPYLANKNVRWGSFDLTELREMRFEEREHERFSVKNGDIVMCEGGEPARCAIWRDELPSMMFQKALHRIRPIDKMNSIFLYYDLSHRAQAGHFSGLFTGSTIKHLPKEKLALVGIDVPPEEILESFEQKVSPMNVQSSELSKLNRELAKARDLLLPRLMDGRLPV